MKPSSMPARERSARARALSRGRRRIRRRASGRYSSLRAYFAALAGVFIVVAGAASAYIHVQSGRDARVEARRDAAFAAASAARELGEDLAAFRAGVNAVAATPGIEKARFISGYTSDAVLQRGVSEAEVAFVQKPFTAEAFNSRLRQLLDSEP
jgi:hypothetical protein